jgi:hypothetical protein
MRRLRNHFRCLFYFEEREKFTPYSLGVHQVRSAKVKLTTSSWR